MSNLNVLVVPSWYPSIENPVEGIFFEYQVESLKKKGLNTGIILPPVINNLEKKNINNLKKYFYKPVIKTEIYNGNKLYSVSAFGVTRIFLMHRLFFRRAGIKLFEKYLSENPRPDIIHAHSAIWGGIFAYFIKMRYNIPYLITEQMTHYEENKIPLNMFPLLKKVFKNADARLTVSPQLGKVLENKLGKNVIPWQWLPYSAEDIFFNASNHKDDENRNSKFRFLNIGMMDEDDRKGHKILLSAFAEKFAGKKDVELAIIGDGPNRKQLEELASNLKINEQVIFKGIVTDENLADEISKCDVFVFPSKIETSGVVVVDALACGKPVVATECNGPECFITKDNGLLVTKSNPELLGEAMESIRNNIKEYLPEKIKEDCFNKFSSGVVAEKLSKIYNKILNEAAEVK
jgi:glycosyltransferase involved in cell wall biosynthesis